ncbi:MAG: hypothetical protein AAFQ41_01725 [Cyanobacteria bacterium J06623_7]
MNYLSEQSTLVWIIFAIYAVSALFIVPNTVSSGPQADAAEHNEQALGFASRFILRIVLILPMIVLLKNNI